MAHNYFIEIGQDGGRLFSGDMDIAERFIQGRKEGGYKIATIDKDYYDYLAKTYRTHELGTDIDQVYESDKEDVYIEGLTYECDDNFTSLQDITGREFGIVIHCNDNWSQGNIVIGNWTQCEGIPHVDPLGIALIGLGGPMMVVETENIDKVLDYVHVDNVIFTQVEEEEAFYQAGKLYKVITPDDTKAIVITPDGWC